MKPVRIPEEAQTEYLGDHDLPKVRTDAEKFLMLAAHNLVECVAFVGIAAAK